MQNFDGSCESCITIQSSVCAVAGSSPVSIKSKGERRHLFVFTVDGGCFDEFELEFLNVLRLSLEMDDDSVDHDYEQVLKTPRAVGGFERREIERD